MVKSKVAAQPAPRSKLARAADQMWRDKVLYLMLLPTLTYFIIFRVWPILNMRLAFYDYKARGPWVWAGLKYFKMLFKTPAFMEILKNTLILSFMKYVLLFPAFVIFALLLNELKVQKFRKYVQVVSYLPHFLSWVVIAGIWKSFLAPADDSAINIDSEVKDAAWAVLEFMASPEGRILDKVGIEGTHYNIEGDKIVFTDKFAGWWARFWDTTNNFNPTPALAAPVLTPAAQDSLDKVNEYMIMDHNLLIPEELTPQWDAMNQLYNEYASDIVRGIKPVDAFDEFVAKWYENGGNDFRDLLQETFG